MVTRHFVANILKSIEVSDLYLVAQELEVLRSIILEEQIHIRADHSCGRGAAGGRLG